MDIMEEIEDFNADVDYTNIEKPKFKISQLKLEHHYWCSGEIYEGMPISTSVELICGYNYNTKRKECKKNISHTYYSLNNVREDLTDSYTEEIDNCEQLISEIEKYDLRELKNNYFTEVGPERYSHWELEYNYNFKIVGTLDQEIDEFKKISEILDFEKIMEEEQKKIEDKIENKK